MGNPTMYFSSDFHFNHFNEGRGIITFERTQFKTIQEHDSFLINMIKTWAYKWAAGSEFWFLGDWGDVNYLWTMDILREEGITTKMIMGNHDRLENKDMYLAYFDAVYQYPIYLSQKLVISHFPVAVYEDQINIHGHTHGSKLQDINHICASLHIADYKPITNNHVNTVFGKIPKYNRRFLYEPFAKDYIFTQPKEDVIMDRDGRIDLSASRVLQKINTERRIQQNDSYQPYTGGLNE